MCITKMAISSFEENKSTEMMEIGKDDQKNVPVANNGETVAKLKETSLTRLW